MVRNEIMIIDMHVHTRAFSPCSRIDPEEAIKKAKEIGLDGLCFTEHEITWKSEDIQRLRQKWNFPVFCGIEVATSEGHILVFGLKEEQRDLLYIQKFRDLQDVVNLAQGVMIVAHPLRSLILTETLNLQAIIRDACTKRVFQMVEAIEIYNGKSTEKENELTREISTRLSVKGVGGSDAHYPQDIGRCITFFENTFTSEEQLAAELKMGRFKARYFRK